MNRRILLVLLLGAVETHTNSSTSFEHVKQAHQSTLISETFSNKTLVTATVVGVTMGWASRKFNANPSEAVVTCMGSMAVVISIKLLYNSCRKPQDMEQESELQEEDTVPADKSEDDIAVQAEYEVEPYKPDGHKLFALTNGKDKVSVFRMDADGSAD